LVEGMTFFWFLLCESSEYDKDNNVKWKI